jgi:small subunit ribosomal protein S1
VNFGPFVYLGGAAGLVHVSALSWKHVDHPSEVVAVGQEVEVEVLDVDLERERVSLSLKATQEDPWKEFERTSQAGSVITGQVTKLVPFGAFVRVAPGIEGLVHISEISHEHVDSPESVLAVGQEVEVKVIDVDVTRRRVSLSMRQVSAPPPRQKEIVAEEEDPRAGAPAGPDMTTTIEVPQAILDAVAAAEVTTPSAASSPAQASTPAPVETEVAPAEEASATPVAAEEAAAADEDVIEIEEAAPTEGEAVAESPDAADGDAAEEGASDEEVSLEAILEDLKRREGRTE